MLQKRWGNADNNIYRVQAYSYIFKVMKSILFLTLLICIVTFQLLQTTLNVGAREYQHYATMPLALSPLLAQSQFVGHSPSEKQLNFSIGLRPQNYQELETYATEISDPASPNYRRFLTPEEFIDRFAPSKANYKQIRQFIEGSGFTITQSYNHRLMIDFQGSVELAERAFHVTINNYRSPDGYIFHSPTQAPQLPVDLLQQVVSVNGLSSAMQWQHAAKLKHSTDLVASKESCPQAGKDALLPQEFAKAYGMDKLYQASYQGRGQGIALFELASANMSDIQSYMRCFAPNQTRIVQIKTGARPPTEEAGQLEVSLDTQLILSAAPQLSMLRIYETLNNETNYLSQWSKIIDDNNPIISISWERCEAYATPQVVRQENVFFQAAAVRGQNIFSATGDAGSTGCLYDEAQQSYDLSATDPSTNPYVISVGGTTLILNEQGGYGKEQVWNNRLFWQNGSTSGASGGGISRYWTMPDWQRAPGIPDNYSTGTPCRAELQKGGQLYCRQTPDVSINADPHYGYWIYCTTRGICDQNNPWIIIGGTSAAAPLWAAMMALSDEMALKKYGKRIGHVTPLLYEIARDPKAYSTCFHDIIDGNNDYTNDHQGNYQAKKGYDLATGLGSYNAFELAKKLTELAQSKK